MSKLKTFLNKYSKVIVVYSIAFVTLFIIANIVIGFFSITLPDSLIVGVFGFFGLEMGVTGWIKSVEEKYVKPNKKEDGGE
jgi:hypothetical protein